MVECGPEMLYDFTITGTKPSAFVSVRYTEHILMLPEEISRECQEKIRTGSGWCQEEVGDLDPGDLEVRKQGGMVNRARSDW